MTTVISAFVAAMLAAAGVVTGGSGTSTYVCTGGGSSCMVGATPTPKPVVCPVNMNYDYTTNGCVTTQNGGGA